MHRIQRWKLVTVALRHDRVDAATSQLGQVSNSHRTDSPRSRGKRMRRRLGWTATRPSEVFPDQNALLSPAFLAIWVDYRKERYSSPKRDRNDNRRPSAEDRFPTLPIRPRGGSGRAPTGRGRPSQTEWRSSQKGGTSSITIPIATIGRRVLAESELGVLSSQCLDRRIPDKQTLVEEIAAWEQDRNANHAKANWHFTTPNARIKLKHLYPST